jgi:excisionase family DNA binding protein
MNKRAGRPSDTGYALSPDRLTAREAAAHTGVSERAIRRAIRRGELAATKHAGRYLIAESEVDRFRRAGAMYACRPLSILPLAAPQPKPLIQLVPPVVQPPSLPETLTSLVGRDATIAAITGLLDQDDVRLLVLTGPGGVGKTRVALHVARSLRPSIADGVAFVALAPIVDPTQVPSAIAQALGVKEADGHPVAGRVIAFLREKRLLLVLDNFEQVTAAGPVVTALLEGCGGLKVLVTSRARLRVRGERAFAVPPLTVLAGERPDAPGDPAEATAVRLFVARRGGNRGDGRPRYV